jgi:hypothetical protein
MKTHRSRRLSFAVAGVAMLVSACSGSSPTPPTPTPTPTPSPSPQASVIGTHTVSWMVGDQCPVIPAEARQGSYDATIENDIVTLRTGVFLDGPICTTETQLGCNQFRITQDADAPVIDLARNTEWHGGSITERLPSGTWLELVGKGVGRIEGTTIQSTLEGNIWYCPESRTYPFPCNTFKACRLSNLQMTIAKKAP